MAMFDPNDPTAGLLSQQQALERQGQLAASLRKQANQDRLGEGRIVGNAFVGPHWTEMLADVFDKYQAGAAERDYSKAQKEYGQQVEQAKGAWSANAPQITPGTAGRPELQGPVDPSTGSPELAAVAPTPAQLPTRSAILEHTLKGMRIPGNEAAAMLWNKGMGEEITREDTQKARKDEKDAALQAGREAKALELEQRERESVRRSEDTRLSIQQRRDAAAEAAAARREYNGIMLELGKIKAGAAGAEKPLPSAQATAWIKNNSSMKALDQALDLVEEHPQAFGFKTNVLGNYSATARDPAGIDARAAVANLGSLKIVDRAGVSQTAAETERLKPFIPNVTGPFADDAATIKKKLRGFYREYANMQQEINEFASAQNYKSPGEPHALQDEGRAERAAARNKARADARAKAAVLPNAVAASAPVVPPTPPQPKLPPGLQLPPGATYIGPAQ